MSEIVFVDFRKPAFKAFQKTEHRCLWWTQTKRLLKASDLSSDQENFVAPFPLSKDLDEEFFSAVQKIKPQAVVALTEKAVLPAAALREKLKGAGLSYAQALRCRDKFEMKRHAQKHHIPTTEFLILDSEKIRSKKINGTSLIHDLGVPLVVKPRLLSGSRGFRLVEDPRDLDLRECSDFLAERFVDAQEVSTELFVHSGKIVFQSITEYYVPLAINIVPARLPKALCRDIQILSQKVVDAFEIERGMVHLEVFLTSQGVLFGELAVRPPGGYLMELLRLSYGFNPWLALGELELGRAFEFPKKVLQSTASWVVHPGNRETGYLKEVQGLEDLSRLSSYVASRIKVKPGQKIEPRLGSGEHVGWVILASPQVKNLVKDLDSARRKLKFVLETP